MRAESAGASARRGRPRWLRIAYWGGLVIGFCVLVFLGLRLRDEWKSKALFQLAEEKWRKADYLGAVHDYERLVENHPDSPLVPEAYYWKGVTAFLYLDDPKGALEAFQKVVAQAPSLKASDLGLKARRYMAEIYEEKMEQPNEAIRIYEALIEATADLETARKSRYKIGELYEAMGDFIQARVEWDLLVKNAPDSPWAPAALYRKGGTYFVTGNCKAALKVYAKVYTHYPDSERSPFAKFRAANCLEMNKQKEAAYALYQDLKDSAYPDPALIARKLEALRPEPSP